MTEEQKAAYINAQVASANCAWQGMVAENQARIHRGESLVYDEETFAKIPEQFGISHNQVREFFRRRKGSKTV